MSVIATAVKHLMAAGVTGETLLAAIEEMEAQVRAEPKPRSSAAIRQERYRAKREISDNEWAALTGLVIERDGWVCSYCDCNTSLPENGYAIDHIYPVSRGGSNDIDNLTMSCRSCNSSKSDKILDDEWTPPNCAFQAWLDKGGEK